MIVQMREVTRESAEDARNRALKNVIKGALVEHYSKPLTTDAIDSIAKEISLNITSIMRFK